MEFTVGNRCKVCGKPRGGHKKIDHSACSKKRKGTPLPPKKEVKPEEKLK